MDAPVKVHKRSLTKRTRNELEGRISNGYGDNRDFVFCRRSGWTCPPPAGMGEACSGDASPVMRPGAVTSKPCVASRNRSHHWMRR
ncbi:hypothetical protein QE152_g4720 [Popillia japonica]|uniref:Uncharacterized protein n=1 Tax=Popillia japonica TaxID=7064 RepID=A0AAW1MXD4_POPJA